MKNKLYICEILIVSDIYYIENAGILIEGNTVKEVGKKSDFCLHENIDTEIIDLGKALVCPGLINLHAHLLYSGFEKIDSSEGLFPWLEKLVDRSKEKNELDLVKSLRQGINEVLSTGTTYIVENTPSKLSITELCNSPLKSLIGIEIFGSEEIDAESIFSNSFNYLSTLESEIKNPKTELTFSPHAAYDVSKPLWERLIKWAESNNKPLLTHLEESPDERNWWQEKSGPAVDFWKKINKLEPKIKYWKQYKSGTDFLSKNNLLTKNLLATHLCQALKSDLIKLKEGNVSLIHCPRSNYYLANGLANIFLWDEFEILWGLGTDSTASNENLDLLEEIKFAINHQNLYNNYKISDSRAFRAITSDPAKILNKGNKIGSLKPGFSADFLIYDISDKSACTYHDPYHLLIWEIKNNKDLKEVYIDGEKVWSNIRQINRI